MIYVVEFLKSPKDKKPPCVDGYVYTIIDLQSQHGVTARIKQLKKPKDAKVVKVFATTDTNDRSKYKLIKYFALYKGGLLCEN